MADLFVRGGRVIDGTGAPAVQANVRVRDGSVVEVGKGLEPAGEEVLDADGAFVTPGFIDVHTHYDGAMWWDRNLDPSPQHGVTTVVTGNCAVSLAPLSERDRASLVDMFCYIEDLPLSAVAERGAVDVVILVGISPGVQRRGCGVQHRPTRRSQQPSPVGPR